MERFQNHLNKMVPFGIFSYYHFLHSKVFRNWMNSLGVKPYVNYLYGDLYNGLVIFQLFDFVQPGIVDWNKRVTQ